MGDLISKYRAKFGEYRERKRENRGMTMKKLLFGSKRDKDEVKKTGNEDVADGEGPGGSSEAKGLKRSKSYGSFLENLSDIMHDDLSGL